MSSIKEIQTVTPYGETDSVLELNIDVADDAYVLEDVAKIVGDYNFSIWIKSEKNDCLTTFNILGTSTIETVTTSWKKVSTTVKMDNLDNNDINIIPDINTTIYLYEGFLSEGTIDNSWIPAPEDSEENIESVKSEFTQTANKIEQKVTASDGKITTLSTSVDGINAEINDAKGDSTSLKARIDGVSIIANSADGKTTKLEANIDGINSEINDAKGNSTTLKARLEGIEATVSDAKGNVATLKTEVDKISSRVTDADNNIGKVDIKVDEVKTEVVNARGDKSTLSVRIDAIESSVQDANGNISNVSQKADSIETKVTNMNIGGRNYILNSRFQGLKETVYNKFEGDSLIFVSTYGANNSACDIVLDCVKDIIYKDGLTLTLSFEYYIDEIENIADGAFIGVELQFIDSAGTSTSQKFPITNLKATNQWGRYIGQLTNIDPSITNIYVHFIKQQSNGSLKYRHPKLEIGDKVSDYSLAPEDLISSIEDVQNNVDKNYEQSVADLKVLQDRIDSIVVTDESGSQVIQTADGVRWNLTQMQQGVNDALDSAAAANENAENAQTSADQLKDQVNDITQKTAYMEIVQQEDGNPCLELGSSDNDFKVRLTNTSLGFYQGTLRVAYITNQALYIETAIIKYSLQFGEAAGFVWRLRENGNFGLQPF